MPKKYNKIQKSDGTVYIDLTSDTVTAATLAAGVTAHNAAGETITGTFNPTNCTWADLDNTPFTWGS